MKKTSLYLTGLTCDNCVRTVVNALLKIEGVDSAEVSNDYEWATVIYDPDLTKPDEMAKAIEATGYGAEV
ncbi:heavy-metal-associated domain-containing protein [bacterium]|nr:heavy-metal-associated domain-containing protein [bacterium]